MISVTDPVATRIKRALAQRGSGEGIQVGVKTTGCSGLAYVLEYVDNPNERDRCGCGESFRI
jgi:iron-sulfur cluster assembly protein